MIHCAASSTGNVQTSHWKHIGQASAGKDAYCGKQLRMGNTWADLMQWLSERVLLLVSITLDLLKCLNVLVVNVPMLCQIGLDEPHHCCSIPLSRGHTACISCILCVLFDCTIIKTSDKWELQGSVFSNWVVFYNNDISGCMVLALCLLARTCHRGT